MAALITLYKGDSKEILVNIKKAGVPVESGYTCIYQIGKTTTGPKDIEVTGTTLTGGYSTIFIPMNNLAAGNYVGELQIVNLTEKITVSQHQVTILPSFD